MNSNDATLKINGTFLSELSFSFPNIVSQNEEVEFLEGGLESAVFPVSFYVVNYSNNIFNYTIEHHGVYTNYFITIPVGNYDYKTLFEVMVIQLNLNGHHFDLTLNEVDGKMTMFYHSTSGRVFYRINYNSSTCFRILGFDISTNYFPVANTLSAPFPLNLLGIKKMKIYCPQFSNNNLDSSGYATTNLITTIINDQAPFGQINYYNNTGEYSGRLKVFEMNTIDIRITDEYGASINFNNCDWSMTFVLILYKENINRSIRRLNMGGNQEQEEGGFTGAQPQYQEQEEGGFTGAQPQYQEQEEGGFTGAQPQYQEETTQLPDETSDNIKDLNFLLNSDPNFLNYN